MDYAIIAEKSDKFIGIDLPILCVKFLSQNSPKKKAYYYQRADFFTYLAEIQVW